ncbi:MAG TPA: hypothetical protein VI731_04380, partial [Bacteroidia bacterium]|nr:hypothetical protein [Bacteroidia bacterium]
TGIASGANVTISQPYVQGAGYEGTLVGTLATMKQGEVKGPINGTLGVYVITLDSVTKPEPLKDVASQKSRSMQALASRADATAMEVLKEKAEIIDNRAKHF